MPPSETSTSETSPSETSPSETSPSVSPIFDTRTLEALPRKNKALRQFVKFCIVGASNFVLDFGTQFVLIYTFHVAWQIANTISFVIGVSNSFFWNSRWTFRALDSSRQAQQYFQFFMINVIGWILNLTIMTGVIYALSGTFQEAKPDRAHLISAKLIATVLVVAWNFGANKKWTFKA